MIPRRFFILLFISICETNTPGFEWEHGNGFNSAPLRVPSHGKPGFELMPPTATGISFTNTLSDLAASENQIRLNGSGVAAGDIDGDGWCDLYFCALEGGNKLFRNLGNWRFVDITQEAGVGCAGQFSTGAVFADIDGDGDLDLLVNGIGTGTRLFLNDGKGHFTEDTSSGLIRKFGSTSLALADIDGDGQLDLYVANYRTTTIRTTGFAVLKINGRRIIRPQDRDQLEYTADGKILEHGEPDVLYRNDKGHFIPLSWTDGTFLDEDGKPLSRPPHDWGLSVMFHDINGDGAPDLYVCNDFHSTDKIWLNDGKGRFRAIPRLALRHTSTFSMCVDFGDLNRDGWDDIFVADMLGLQHSRRLMQLAAGEPYLGGIGMIDDRPQFDRNTVQLNRGDGTYADVAEYAGLDASDWTWSAILLDVDLDGFEDVLCATGHMFDTQDLDAEARIQAKGPWRYDQIPQKLLMFPKMRQAKAAFRNRGDLTFEKFSEAWCFNQSGVANGMALADLDNDGALDVIVNNLNGAAGVYRNLTDAPRIAIRLKGATPNTQGIGAKIKVFGGAVPLQSQEMICGGRYLSGDDAMRVFAAGSTTNEMRIEVNWRSGKKSVVSGVKPNRVYEVAESGSVEAQAPNPRPEPVPLFEEASVSLNHSHHEDFFDDFERQRLLPNRLSQLGPGISWVDMNGDGWEDLIIGSGKGGKMAVYQNDGHGGFQNSAVFGTPVTRDQTSLLGWRANNGNLLLLAGSANYEDGLALGSCVRQYDIITGKTEDSFPGQESSSGPLALGDVAGIGELELFVGGRVIAGRYPEAASSSLFKHRQGQWVLDEENTKVLRQVGLVSGAIWTDLNGDGYPELVLACEWGPVKVFRNDNGRLSDATRQWGLSEYAGWWNGIAAGDFDGDGRMDLVVSNWGLNTKYRSSRKYPRRLYYGDFGGSGSVDVIESSFDQELNKWVPERDLNSMTAALPYLKEKYPLYEAYGNAGVEEMLGEGLKKARILEANWLETTVFLNRGDHFELGKLPREAQFAPAFGVNVADIYGEGKEDIFLSQNFFAVQPQTPRNDAGRGLLLRGDGKGNFNAVSGQESGIQIYGEQRGSAVCDYDHDGRVDLVATQNGAQTKLYHNVGGRPGLRVRLEGTAGNPDGIGAAMRLKFGQAWGPMREVHAGSGYWSQDSTAQVLATPQSATQIQIRWPGGKTTGSDLPREATAITVDINGRVKTIP